MAKMLMAGALLAATRTNSEILGMKDLIGSVEVGKLADIIAVDADPFKDPTVMMNVTFVMKDGVVYKLKGEYFMNQKGFWKNYFQKPF